MRALLISAITLASLFAAPAVFAVDSTLTWKPVTQYTDNTAITKPVTYNVYQNKGATPIVSGLTVLTHVIKGHAYGTFCFAVTATVEGVESDRSTEGCKTVAAPVEPKKVPKKPTAATAT
jgi:hypothetical protein